MHSDHATFITALESRQKLSLRFFSKEDGHPLTSKCAPLDYGPSRRTKDKSDRYHFWDYESDEEPHQLSLLPSQIISMELLGEPFEPEEVVTWTPVLWFYPREWGPQS
jgi:hypothetical protein